MLAVRHDAIIEDYVVAKDAAKHLFEKVDIIFFKIFIYERTGHTNEHHLRSLIKGLEDDPLEPCFELLFGNILAYKRKTLFPKRLRISFHILTIMLIRNILTLCNLNFDAKLPFFFRMGKCL